MARFFRSWDGLVSVRWLTILYVGALSTVAILCVLSQVIVQRIITQQGDDSSLINVAGRQRMLSQRIAKSALALANATDDAERTRRHTELAEALELFDASHHALLRRDHARNLDGTNSVAVLDMFDDIAQFQLEVVGAGRALANLDQALPPDATAVKALVARILGAEPEFLPRMDAIVAQYETEASARVASLRQTEQVSLAAVLIVLALEALLVFRPAVRGVRRAVAGLKQAEAERAEASRELSTIFDSVPALILHYDADGRVLRINASGAQIIGEAPEKILGASVYDFFTGQEARLREEDREIFRTQASQLGLLHYLQNSQGDTRWLRMNKIPHAAPAGAVGGVIMFAVDVSEHKRLERRLMVLRSEEERRLGYTLHDGLGQELSGILYLGRRLVNRLRGAGREETSEANEVLELVKRCIESVRDLSKTLRPIGEEPDALTRSLRELATKTRETAGVDCALEERGSVLLFERDVAEHLYRIAQEAVNNAVRHSGAKEIRIRLSQGDDETILEIEDDGCGMDTARLRAERSSGRDPESLGLSIMEHRAELIGGRFRISSRLGAGTTVRCAVAV
jgi:two-component system sensor histidine kinase DegS